VKRKRKALEIGSEKGTTLYKEEESESSRSMARWKSLARKEGGKKGYLVRARPLVEWFKRGGS